MFHFCPNLRGPTPLKPGHTWEAHSWAAGAVNVPQAVTDLRWTFGMRISEFRQNRHDYAWKKTALRGTLPRFATESLRSSGPYVRYQRRFRCDNTNKHKSNGCIKLGVPWLGAAGVVGDGFRFRNRGVISQCKARHRHQEFLRFLQHLAQHSGWFGPPSNRRQLLPTNIPRLRLGSPSTRRFHLHFAPTY
jgi:hypothetical protein